MPLEGSDDDSSDSDPEPTKSPSRVRFADQAKTSLKIGSDASRLTSRHKRDGKVSKVAAKNTFISVGRYTASISALKKVYGSKLCPAALCSFGVGDRRLLVCDCAKDAAHKKMNSGAHKLPKHSGPNDSGNWEKVQRLSRKRPNGE